MSFKTVEDLVAHRLRPVQAENDRLTEEAVQFNEKMKQLNDRAESLESVIAKLLAENESLKVQDTPTMVPKKNNKKSH